MNKPHPVAVEAFQKKIEQIAIDLNSNLKNGLPEIEAKQRLQIYGLNTLPSKKALSLLQLFVKQFKDFMILLLLAVSVISFLIQDIKDTIVILAVVVLNTILGFIQEYKAEKTIEALKHTASPQAKVIRDGKIKLISTGFVVPGDLLIIEEGDIVQADGRITEVVNLSTQESFITGEPLPMDKQTYPLREKRPLLSNRTNMIFRGSTVVRGHGKALVTATGSHSELGKIAHLIREIKDKPTPLEKKLTLLGKRLVLLTIILCLLIATIGILRGIPTLTMLEMAIVLGIACIPEGLVAVVTIALAFGVQRMAKKKAIIRRLPAVETLGSVTMICCDKTGTLTEGNMAAKILSVNHEILPISGTAQESLSIPSSEELTLLLTIAVLCNNATLQKKETIWETFGDPTEGALLRLGLRAGFLKEKLLEQAHFIKEFPFDTKRKSMSHLYEFPENKYILMTKGAPEQILKIINRDRHTGIIRTLAEENKQEILKQVNTYAAKGFRVLALAYKELSADGSVPEIASLECDMIYVGFIAILDPLREEAPLAIQKCLQSGIRTMMLTGDHPHTAHYIAQQLGMITSEREVANAQRLELLPPAEFSKAIQPYKVIARVSPQIKLKIVEGLRNQGEIVAMTGDGVNDAPAIKRSNVGIAMGKTGTDVAKEAADIVLADDNFSTIVDAIEEGRTIYSNILKFIRYLLSCNMGEILIMFFATLFAMPLPFLPIQILWLNLVTDTPPALALGVEPVEPGTMLKPPRKPNEPIFSRSMISDIFINGFIMSAITLGIFYYHYEIMGLPLTKARTISFATLVLMQLFHAFNCQHEMRSIFVSNPLGNLHLMCGVLFSALLLVVSIHIPIIQNLFGLVEMTGKDWALSSVASLLIIVVVEIQKWFTRANSVKAA